jgi:hypothetical protein
MGSPRRTVLETLRDAARIIRNSVYFAKRGAINWTVHNFEKHPRAIAVMQDDAQLFGDQKSGMKFANMSLEMFARMPERLEVPEIDDVLMDEMIDDAYELLRGLITARDVNDDPVVFKLDQASARVIESHDVDLKVQGIVVSFSVTY